jgi:translation initiation factor 4A
MFKDFNRKNFNNDRDGYNNRGYNNRDRDRDRGYNRDREYNREREYNNRENFNDDKKEETEENKIIEKEVENEIIEEYVYDSSLYEINSWEDCELDEKILRGIFSYGFERPSAIQQKAIKPIMMGKDIIAQAQSGTGKTATFTIGALSHVNVNDNFTQILALSPTRELAIQTAKVFTGIGSIMEGLRVMTLFGGSSIDETTDTLKHNPPHIICGCTGRIFDMIRRDKITYKKIKLIILDEADEMLSSGFKDQVYNIFQYLNSDAQVALFSATLPDNILQLTKKFMRDPVKICIKPERLTLDGIKQYYVGIDDDRQKYLVLKDIYSYVSVSHTIIYCNSVKRVVELYEAMKEDGFPVCCIHSNMDKVDRDQGLVDFRTGNSRILISSNVTARGIDVQQVSTVINFDLPKCVHTYLHRIGRSGRWGRKGLGINFISRRDMYKLREIKEHYMCEINELPGDLNNLIHF